MPEEHVEILVFCPVCKGENNTIWKGTLFEWLEDLEKPDPPKWYQYALQHQAAHGHVVMVRYEASGLTVPLTNAARRRGKS
jgi:hypothetical protein